VVGIKAMGNVNNENPILNSELLPMFPNRRLDISKECIEETKLLWENEVVEWRFPWTIECDDSPCDAAKVQNQYHQAYKNQCKAREGQFVQYTYKFPEELYAPVNETNRQLLAPFFLVVYNHPDCISKSCNANQFASYLQGIDHVEQNNTNIYVYDQTMISKQCMEQTMEMSGVQPLSPYNLGCEEYPCDASKVAAENHSSVKAQCKSLGGQFVEYTVKFKGTNVPFRMLETAQEVDYEVNNYPGCIGQSCDAYQLTSYLQGAYNVGTTDTMTYFITQTSSSKIRYHVSLGSVFVVTIGFILSVF
jgi:hypothetical protein